MTSGEDSLSSALDELALQREGTTQEQSVSFQLTDSWSYPYGLVMPLDFSEQQKQLLYRDISDLRQLEVDLTQQWQPVILKEKINALYQKWQSQGVVVRNDFIQAAQESKEQAEASRTEAKKLEELYEEALKGNNDSALFLRCYEYAQKAEQVMIEWQKTAALHLSIPGPFTGSKLQKRWQEKVEGLYKDQEEVVQTLIQKAQELANTATTRIEILKQRQAKLIQEEKWDDAADVGAALKQIELTQKVTQERNNDLAITKPSQDSSLTVASKFYDRKKVLALDVASDALQYTMLEADQLESATEEDQGEVDGRTTNESLLSALAQTPKKKPSAEEEKFLARVVELQGRINKIKKYHEELASLTDTASIMLQAGDIEFSDPTDSNRLASASQEVQVALIFLDAMQRKSGDPCEDDFSLNQKEGYIFEVLQLAFGNLISAINVIGDPNKYRQSPEIEGLLKALHELEKKNPTS